MYGGKKLRQLRQHLGLNQDDFATELNISQPYYSAIESGKKQITNKLLEQVSSKWKIDRDYFEDQNIKSIVEYLGVKIGGNIGGKSDESIYLDSIKKSLIQKSPRMEFVYKAYEELKISNPELAEIRYNISNLAALLIDAELIYTTYLQSAINDDVNADTFKEYKIKLIAHLTNFIKYNDTINPIINSLKAFILEFKSFDSDNVIDHSIEELKA
jgi:transcriptional regulator with XRE-family HTH domain